MWTHGNRGARTETTPVGVLGPRLCRRNDSGHGSWRGEGAHYADPVVWVDKRRGRGRVDSPVERRRLLAEDLDSIAMVSCDPTVAALASVIGETLGVRSVDAIHLASAQRLQIPGITFLTFDLRQGQAARTLGFNVLGC
jgi:predicted nucleic acid-binding protein